MKIYVAGASFEADVVAGLMESLRQAGHEITHDWTVFCREARASGVTDASLSPEDRFEQAQACMDAVRRADCVWLVVPETQSIGAWIECGIALALGKTFVVSGDYQRTIFASQTELRFASHAEAIEWFKDPKAVVAA